MRIIGYNDKSGQKQQIFTALLQECQLANPGSRLSDNLRRKIEEVPRNERDDVVKKMIDGCAPLFLACKNGSADVAEYLLDKCDAPVEQKGLFEVLDEGVSHNVSPLWCAAVSGRLAVVKVLLRYGADINAVSDSGSTPVRSTCYIVRPGLTTSHMEIIKCLVTAGANIQIPNYFGGTCLINSVQSPELVEFLLSNGANVNAEDVQHKTALHYAVQEHRLDTAKILVSYGANPFKISKYGDDVLQTACLKGAVNILNYLLEVANYSIERICDAFDLMGSSFLLDSHDMGSAIFFWKKSLELRQEGPGGPYIKPYFGVHPVFAVEEFASSSELEELSFDILQMKVQALLMTERILGSSHKDTIFRYMYAGAAHADSAEYRTCIQLWNYALGLKIQKETLLSSDTSFTVRAVIQLYLNIMFKEQSTTTDYLQFEDVVKTTKFINGGLRQSSDLLSTHPQFQTQLDNLDMVLQSWIHLIYILLRLARDPDERSEVFHLVKTMKTLDIETQGGDSVVHLASTSHLSNAKSNNYLEEENMSLFPSPEVLQFLLDSGFDVEKKNHLRETPLHLVSKTENYSIAAARVLLDFGAHLDSLDMLGVTPLSRLRSEQNLNCIRFISLKCLASTVIREHQLLVNEDHMPREVIQFYRCHL